MVSTIEIDMMAYNRGMSHTMCTTTEPVPLVYICKICSVVMRGSGAGKLCRPCSDLHRKGLSGMKELREVDMNDDEIRAGIREYRIDWDRDPTSIQVANTHTLTMLYRGFDLMRNYTNNRLYGIKVIINNKVPSTKVWLI